MTTNPTPEHREQAREIAEIQNRAQEKYGNVRMGEPLEEPCPGCGCVTFAAARKDVNTLLAAISSRDTEVREVLEGLSTLIRYRHGQPERCWCNNQNSNWTHTQECLAVRDLYAKLQPGKKKLTGR